MREREHVKGWIKQTDNKFLNMYEAQAVDGKGNSFSYYFATRRKNGELMCQTGRLWADGAVFYAVIKDDPSKILLVRQYRYPVNNYVYELPAGLIDEGETALQTAVREIKEETGMDFEPFTDYPDYLKRPFVQSQGMADECDITVYGYASGIPSTEGNEATEDIEVIIADKKKVKEILSEGIVTIRAAYLLVQFLKSSPENPFGFLDI
ncbi:MAG: NUDIX hydrolase [Lachnospiraceae bacterium]|nr:NUDIX hydrolase [Lachnospiraceae bacterium]